MAKLTFSVDDETVAQLRQAAEDLRKPQSMVVREAVREYHARYATMTAEERLRKLAIMDKIMRRPAGRPGTAAAEVSDVRRARRQGGRRTRVDD